LRQKREEKEFPLTKILYCSRTHSQLNQVIKELKRTLFRPKTVLLGSRDQMWVNTDINHHTGITLNSKCKTLRKNSPLESSWKYFRNTSSKKNPKNIGWEIFDIEDLHAIAKDLTVCPYYLQKARIADADIILMPYNYLLDAKIRSQYAINFEESIIIFDEAHNIEKVWEEISSFEISINSLSEVINELSNLSKYLQSFGESKLFNSSVEEIGILKTMTSKFKSILKQFDPKELKEHRKSRWNIFRYHQWNNHNVARRESIWVVHFPMRLPWKIPRPVN
jgi:regulator of telomere elongation helicase 1